VLTIGLVQGAGSQGAPDVAKVSLENGSLVAIERIEREMELMKKIVSGLVDSVQTLSKEGALKEADSLIEGPFPIPVEVTAPKAALRKEGDRSATVVADVTKGTVLLAHASAGGWLKVSTPKGETAWVSQGLAAEKKTWR
jgi:SH3-like domain-containing protein